MPRRSEFVYVQGKGSWVKHLALNKWDKWSMCLYPDAASLEIIRDLQSQGIKNVIKKDEDGYYTTFSRPDHIMVNGKRRALDAPLVILKDGTPLPDTLVGNGSDVTVKLEVYQHGTPNGGTAKAARWLSLRVDNLIPYDGHKAVTADERAVKGLNEQPLQEGDGQPVKQLF